MAKISGIASTFSVIAVVVFVTGLITYSFIDVLYTPKPEEMAHYMATLPTIQVHDNNTY